MSTPVVTDKWAGNYDCSVCRRKRLMGSEFSKKSLEKYRKSNNTHSLKCKQCVAKQESKERELAAAKNTNNDINNKNDEDSSCPITCSSCKRSLLPSFYNRNQLSKGPGKARCRSCVEEAVANELKQSKEGKEEKLAKARERVRIAEERGTVMEKVKAEADLAALEAEIVTGLKPVMLGRGRGGRGYIRGGGRGRGRSQKK